MDKERERVRADLLGLLEGEVLGDPLSLRLYASDASIWECQPLIVVRPRNTADVSATLRYADDNGLSIHARGAGSGVAGESLGSGIVVDFTRFMNRQFGESQGDDTVRVQPGLVLADLNRRLAAAGRFFGPDPSTRSVTSIGSVIALDASGSHWLRYGSTRDHVRSVQCVLADGTVVELSQHELAGEATGADGSVDPARRLGKQTAGIIERYRGDLDAARRKSRLDRVGYRLTDLVAEGRIDLARLITGSEGTLALITEATLATSPLPQRRGVVLLFFSRLDTAARAAADVVKAGADACDLMDRRLLSIARELDPEYERIIPPVAEAMLLVEFQADTSAELNLKLKDLATRVRKRYRETFEAPIALETEQRNRFWRLARRVIPTLYRLKGARRAVPFVEDIAVPPEQLPQFLVTAQNIFKQHQVTASIFSHAGHGQLHLRPFVDLADPATPELLVRLAEALYHETLAIGGTISGEHGLGWSRSWFARRQLGNAWQAMQAVKQLFDPKRRLNPDKVFTDETQPPRRQLRQVRAKIAYRAATETDDESVLDDFESASRSVDDPSSVSNLIVPEREPATAVSETPALPILDLNLVWKPDELTTAARTCNGCGRCRTTGSEERMCPIFRGDPREESTPRAKANLMRAIATGQLEPDKLATGEFKRLVDLCVNCHQCRIDCPANVDIPKLMIEAKSQYVGRNGMTPSDWAMARIDLAMALASRFAPQANWLVRRPFVRWGLEKFFGIAAARPLPRFQKRSFLREAARRGLTSPPRRGGRRVAYFVDSLANWCDLELAWSVVQVLERQGIAVYVPPKQRPSGMSLISSGALERARRYAEANVELLAECVRQGYDIVCSEPAATLALKHEYPQLLDDSDARLVASRTEDIQAYLVGLKREDRMELDLKPLNYTLAYHLPCHQRALYGESPSLELLSMIRGLQVRPVEKGCSGMAGTWGMKRENYRRSLRIGQPLAVELRRADYSATVSECSACRMQIEHLSRKTTIHPIKLLAMSYGLLPDDKRLTRYASETTV